MKVEVWKSRVLGEWTWTCFGCGGGWLDTHAEALGEALDHVRYVHWSTV